MIVHVIVVLVMAVMLMGMIIPIDISLNGVMVQTQHNGGVDISLSHRKKGGSLPDLLLQLALKCRQLIRF